MNYINIEAEQQLLGAILLHNETFAMVGDVLQADHFAEPVHQRIFAHCAGRIAKSHLVSPVTVKLDFEGDAGLKELGGAGYLARMAGASVAPSSAREYARVIIEAACRRALDMSAVQAQEALSGGMMTAHEVKMGLLHALSGLPEPAGEESSYSLLSAMLDAARDAADAYQGNVSFLQTGIPSLDKILKGLGPADFCIVAGATSMGKTSLALEIANNIAFAPDRGVVFVSLEMTRQQLATRMASARARVPYSDMRDPASLPEKDFRRWLEASQDVGKGNMRIIPRHVRDIPAIHAAVDRAGNELRGNLSAVIVDYVQLIRGPGKDRYTQMTEVSIMLKHMAGMMGVPLIGLCQLSRNIGDRDDKRPQLSDIKETGQLENDADQVVFCHREEYWLSRQGPRPDKRGDITSDAQAEWQADLSACKNKMELIVRKNRHGPLAIAEVGFHDATNRFWELGNDDSQDF